MAKSTVANKPESSNGVYVKPKAELVKITPDLARTWLTKNVHNRSFRPAVAATYARDMKAGAWEVTGEAIKFDWDDNLIDGQHRLSAIIEANVAVTMFVMRGLRPTAQNVMDTGAKRIASDALALNGYKYSALTAAGARLAINYEAGFKSGVSNYIRKVSNAEMLAFVSQNQDIAEMAEVYSRCWRSFPANGSVVVFTAWALARIDAAEAVAFFDVMVDKQTNGKGDPRSALLKRFESMQRHGEKVSVVTQADWIFRAWNAHRKGQRMDIIKYQSGAFTEPK